MISTAVVSLHDIAFDSIIKKIFSRSLSDHCLFEIRTVDLTTHPYAFIQQMAQMKMLEILFLSSLWCTVVYSDKYYAIKPYHEYV